MNDHLNGLRYEDDPDGPRPTFRQIILAAYKGYEGEGPRLAVIAMRIHHAGLARNAGWACLTAIWFTTHAIEAGLIKEIDPSLN